MANAPHECEEGLPGLSQCGPGDHVAGRGQMSVHHASGRIVDEDGTASYGAHLRVGDTSRGLFEGDPGLLDARGAEVILVLKSTVRASRARRRPTPTIDPRQATP